ncbi:MAG: hypothetical protein B7Y15_06150 [Bacteroidetes bacterium 24-39-8]|jgi:hypothetical protein|nr:MAG: hypothetical protein B7Y15_06150 [Bacteroidetes bacterium 24-39-8]OZA63839.1 MAG: hypothetical protein B7X72_09700 [Sphingobacteriia bacterium 39-39-8]HQR93582.1 hypothetical protein [Sediminibacterium sp.]HQS55532.1 hypothetical protein [Sediminibacterium sp.]
MGLKTILLGLLLLPFLVFAQKSNTYRFQAINAMFPDTARAAGHQYQGKQFPASLHYNDASVLVHIPDHFKPTKPFELVFWFHGWYNNIDSATAFFRLLEQFDASGRNAIFAFPEGPKNAPDSYGGKLEQPGVFDALVQEVLTSLQRQKILKKKQLPLANDLAITLAGHSGAYRVISKIIVHANIKEVFLFDALYGGNEHFMKWVAASEKHRLINIYTKDGGTRENSLLVAKELKNKWNLNPVLVDEKDLTNLHLFNHRILFIDSHQQHNEVITYQNNLERYLKIRI